MGPNTNRPQDESVSPTASTGSSAPVTAPVPAPPKPVSPTTGPVLDAPFNGALQPADPTVLNQGSLLDRMPLDMAQDEPVMPKQHLSRQRLVGLGLLLFGCLAAVVLGIRIEVNKSKVQNTSLITLSSKLAQQQAPIASLNKQLGTASSAKNNAVTVNGQLNVTNSLVLQPSVQSGPAVTGQMYYDSTTNTLAYYNGTGFVHLQGGSTTPTVVNNTYITSITNATGSGTNINGTLGTLALFATGSTLGDSAISQSGSNVAVNGTVRLQNGTNSSTAFQVQNASSNALLTADTTNNAIVLGSDGTPGNVTLRGGNGIGGNVTGANLTIQASNGTGSATSGNIVFLTGVSAEGGIEFDSANAVAYSSTMNFTVGTQANRILLVNTDCNTTSLTFDGRPLTLLDSATFGGQYGSGNLTNLWYLLDPPSGTYTISNVYTTCNNPQTGHLGAVAYYNVNQTTPFGTVATAHGAIGGTNSSDLAVTSTSSSQLVVDTLVSDDFDSPCITTGTGQTLRWQVVHSFAKEECGSDIVGTGGVVHFGYQLTNADWAAIGVPLNPATAQSVPLQTISATTPDALYNRLDITSGGNIGIDNTTPQYSLDVNGVINSSTAVYTPALDTNTPGALNIGQYDATSVQIGNAVSNIPIDLQGTTIIKPTVDATNAFQVQNASGNALLTADTVNNDITAAGNTIVNEVEGCNYTNYTDYMAGLNPVGYWKLDDSGTTAADSSGNGNTGTLTNVTTGVTPGPFSCATTHPAMAFSSASSSKITTSTTFNDPSTYSQVVMFKTNGGNGPLLSFDDPGVPGSAKMLYVGSDGKLYAGAVYYGGSVISSSSAVNDGNWHTAVAVENGTGLYLYLDGQLVASNANDNFASYLTGSWDIGHTVSTTYWGNLANASFNGDIAEAAVTPVALTSTEVSTLATYGGFLTSNLASLGIGTTSPTASLDVAGTALFENANNSLTAFQIQNSLGSALFTADTSNVVITIAGTATDFATLAVTNAHFESTQTTAPTIGTPANCGTGATASVTAGSTDSAGSFTIHAGTGSPTTCDTTITFNQPYGTAPKSIVLTPTVAFGGTAAPTAQVSSPSTTAFTAEIAPTDASAGATYSYYYWVVE